MPRVAELLAEARSLTGDEPRRDAEVLLCSALDKPRSYLFAWPEAEVAERYRDLLARRRAGEPVAYLLRRREFWSLDLEVGSDVLIPRPETELLVELALGLPLADPTAQVLDLGTGSGAIALALASERPDWRVVAVDASASAIAVAERNRRRLGLDNVDLRAGDWFAPVGDARFAIVVSNPPYLAEDDPHLARGDLRSEPRAALVADDGGLGDLRRIVEGAPAHLLAGGWILLEHGMTQGEAVRACLHARGYEAVETRSDLAGRERVTLGRWSAADLP